MDTTASPTNSKLRKSLFHALPEDVCVHILSFVAAREKLCAVSLVSRQLHRLVFRSPSWDSCCPSPHPPFPFFSLFFPPEGWEKRLSAVCPPCEKWTVNQLMALAAVDARPLLGFRCLRCEVPTSVNVTAEGLSFWTHFPKVELLHLDCRVTDESLSILQVTSSHMPRLQSLGLVVTTPFPSLVRVISQFPPLRALDLDCSETSALALDWSPFLIKSRLTLETLRVRDAYPGPAHPNVLRELPRCPNLRVLHFDAQFPLSLLPTLPVLTNLLLGEGVADAEWPPLKECVHLSDLTLRHGEISPLALQSMGDCPGLTALRFDTIRRCAPLAHLGVNLLSRLTILELYAIGSMITPELFAGIEPTMFPSLRILEIQVNYSSQLPLHLLLSPSLTAFQLCTSFNARFDPVFWSSLWNLPRLERVELEGSHGYQLLPEGCFWQTARCTRLRSLRVLGRVSWKDQIQALRCERLESLECSADGPSCPEEVALAEDVLKAAAGFPVLTSLKLSFINSSSLVDLLMRCPRLERVCLDPAYPPSPSFSPEFGGDGPEVSYDEQLAAHRQLTLAAEIKSGVPDVGVTMNREAATRLRSEHPSLSHLRFVDESKDRCQWNKVRGAWRP